MPDQVYDSTEILKKIFEDRHGKLWLKTDICKGWDLHHKNCDGCKHEEKCKGFINWVMSITDGHSPEEFLDHPLDYDSGSHDPPTGNDGDPFA